MIDEWNRLNAFRTDVKELHGILDNLLQSDDDMACMYLTERVKEGKFRPIDKHEEIEMLLEKYESTLEDIIMRIEETQERIQSVQEFITISLDRYG